MRITEERAGELVERAGNPYDKEMVDWTQLVLLKRIGDVLEGIETQLKAKDMVKDLERIIQEHGWNKIVLDPEEK